MKIGIWLDWNTCLAALWRATVAVMDWRTHLRRLTRQPILDVVFVTNMRDQVDRKRYLGLWHPKAGHFNGPRYWINGVAGRTRALDITSRDLASPEGRERAKKHFIDATRWAVDRGAKVILLAAGTKRLFGTNDHELKRNFPKTLFTIGDCGTVGIFQKEIAEGLTMLGLTNNSPSRIAVLGPYGLLGEAMCRYLISSGYEIVGAGPNESGLKRVKAEFGIKTVGKLASIGKVDAVVACTHSDAVRLTADSVESLRKGGRRLPIWDVAEPSNLTYREYRKCRDRIIRFDAGNAYSPNLKYVLGAISYRLFRLSKGVTFGCFAEALAIAFALKARKYSQEIHRVDFYDLSAENIKFVSRLFGEADIGIPRARCFSRLIQDFNLTISQHDPAN